MYFLLETCQHPAVLRTLYFGSLIKDIIFTIIPIGIILMTLIDFSKAVVAGKEDEQQKAVKLIPKRIMYAIIVFAIPWIVTILMKTLYNLKLGVAMDYQLCINNAKSGAETGFKKYDEMLEAEEELEKIYSQGSNGSQEGNEYTVNDNSAYGRLISLIDKEVGKTDGTKYGAGSSSTAWCAYFTTWALKNTKFNDGTSIYYYLRKYGDISDGEASGMWPVFRSGKNKNITFNKAKAYGGNYTPKPGDIIWFQWASSYCRPKYGLWDGVNKCADHIGIVEYVKGDTVHTIEGNSGGKVSRLTYKLNNDVIVAYGSWYN